MPISATYVFVESGTATRDKVDYHELFKEIFPGQADTILSYSPLATAAQ